MHDRLAALSRNWWLFLIRGILAILFGGMAIIWPGVTLVTLILLFGAYVLVDGLFAIVLGLSRIGSESRWWALLLQGIAGVIIGIIAFASPGTTALALLMLIAAWNVVTGIASIGAAIQLRKVIENEWLLIISGIISILIGLYLFFFPGPGALAMTLVFGIYFIVFGILSIVFAFRLRSLGQVGDRAPSG